MDEKQMRIIAYLLGNPHSIGKEIAQKTNLSESDVSKRLNMLKKEGVVDSIFSQPQKGKGYIGKSWHIINDAETIVKLTDFAMEREQSLINEIKELTHIYDEIRNHGCKYPTHDFVILCHIVPKMCPPYVDPRKISAALLAHDTIFELERTYYETKIAPHNQAIENAKTQEERDKAIQQKDGTKARIIGDLFTLSLDASKKRYKDYTKKEEEWVNFMVKYRIQEPLLDTPV